MSGLVSPETMGRRDTYYKHLSKHFNYLQFRDSIYNRTELTNELFKYIKYAPIAASDDLGIDYECQSQINFYS